MSKFGCALIVFNALAWSSQLMATSESREVICPMVYQPATCIYEEFSAYGSNRCFAYAALQEKLQRLDIKVDPKEIRCYEGELALLKSREHVAS